MVDFEYMKSSFDIWNEAWALYVRNWQLITTIYALPWVLSIIPLFIPQTPTAFIIDLVGIILSVLATIGVVYVFMRGHEATFTDALAYAQQYFLGYLWVGLLSLVIILVGFVLLIIPGIIVSVWLAFAGFILLIEGKTGLEALKASRQYVRGRWFPVAVRLLFFMIISILVSMLFVFASVIIQESSGSIAGAVAATLPGLFLPALGTAYAYSLYLTLRTQALQNAPAPVAPQPVSETAPTVQ
jgi:hypothetical protein